MSGPQYWQGQAVELRVTFVGAGGAVATASGVSFRVRKPDATLVTVSASADLVRPGDWIGVVVADQVGTWTVRATCTAPQPAVEQLDFTVKAALPG
jgi:hypothetical protein